MLGTDVSKYSLHSSFPRLQVVSPAAVGFRLAVSPSLPTLKNTVSPRIRFWLSSSTMTFRSSSVSTDTTFSPNRKTMPRARAEKIRWSTTSESQKFNSCLRPSTMVTLTPSTANIMPYSRPMTPPPITIIDRGISLMFRISSLSKIRAPSNGT